MKECTGKYDGIGLPIKRHWLNFLSIGWTNLAEKFSLSQAHTNTSRAPVKASTSAADWFQLNAH